MSKTLTEIAQQLSAPRKVKNKKATEIGEVKQVPKVQLIYAFNGTGKTRLSRVFKQLIAPKSNGSEGGDEADIPELSRNKILYYNAFTEDLFYWDNDLELDADYKLKIQPNSFTDWVLKDQGQELNIITIFQRYTNDKLTPRFNAEREEADKEGRKVIIKAFSEVAFSMESGDEAHPGYQKISKSEESNFIWSIFYALLQEVISTQKDADPDYPVPTPFDDLEYVFIDDPVSSLDENHLIQLAVDLATLIRSSVSDLKFVVTTHNPLFYNVLHNELNNKTCYLLERFEDGTFALLEKSGDSNKSFSYHLHLMQTIEKAIAEGKVEKYHFTLLRNLYEKTASFLGYSKWSALLPDDSPDVRQLYLSRVMNFASHSALSNEAVADPTPQEKSMVDLLLKHLKNKYVFWMEEG